MESAPHACRAAILLASWRCVGMVSVGMEGYRLFRKDRQGEPGGSVMLYVSACCRAWSSTWGWMRGR